MKIALTGLWNISLQGKIAHWLIIYIFSSEFKWGEFVNTRSPPRPPVYVQTNNFKLRAVILKKDVVEQNVTRSNV